MDARRLLRPDHHVDPALPCVMSASSSVRRSYRLLDSGSSMTITSDKELFSPGTLKPSRAVASAANGTIMTFPLKGIAMGIKAYYSPDATSTLIALSDLIEENDSRSVNEGRRIIFTNRQTGETTWQFELRGRLWHVLDGPGRYVMGVCEPLNGRRLSSVELLHQRLGHAHFGLLRNMIKHKSVDGLEAYDIRDFEPPWPYCHGCALGKAKQSPFAKVSSEQPSLPGQRWHWDLITVRTSSLEDEKDTLAAQRGHSAKFLMVSDFGFALHDRARALVVTRRHVRFNERGLVHGEEDGVTTLDTPAPAHATPTRSADESVAIQTLGSDGSVGGSATGSTPPAGSESPVLRDEPVDRSARVRPATAGLSTRRISFLHDRARAPQVVTRRHVRFHERGLVHGEEDGIYTGYTCTSSCYSCSFCGLSCVH